MRVVQRSWLTNNEQSKGSHHARPPARPSPPPPPRRGALLAHDATTTELRAANRANPRTRRALATPRPPPPRRLSPLLETSARLGLRLTDDFNRPGGREGVGYYQFNIRDGVRDSAAGVRLGPLLKRINDEPSLAGAAGPPAVTAGDDDARRVTGGGGGADDDDDAAAAADDGRADDDDDVVSVNASEIHPPMPGLNLWTRTHVQRIKWRSATPSPENKAPSSSASAPKYEAAAIEYERARRDGARELGELKLAPGTKVVLVMLWAMYEKWFRRPLVTCRMLSATGRADGGRDHDAAPAAEVGRRRPGRADRGGPHAADRAAVGRRGRAGPPRDRHDLPRRAKPKKNDGFRSKPKPPRRPPPKAHSSLSCVLLGVWSDGLKNHRRDAPESVCSSVWSTSFSAHLYRSTSGELSTAILHHSRVRGLLARARVLASTPPPRRQSCRRSRPIWPPCTKTSSTSQRATASAAGSTTGSAPRARRRSRGGCPTRSRIRASQQVALPPPVRRLQQHWCGFSSREDVPGLSFCVLEGSQRLVLLRLVSRSSVGRRAHFFCDV